MPLTLVSFDVIELRSRNFQLSGVYSETYALLRNSTFVQYMFMVFEIPILSAETEFISSFSKKKCDCFAHPLGESPKK